MSLISTSAPVEWMDRVEISKEARELRDAGVLSREELRQIGLDMLGYRVETVEVEPNKRPI